MKVLKPIFLCLAALGICGGIYLVLYAGMRGAGLALAEPQPDGGRPHAQTRDGAGHPPATAEPEDPKEVLQQRLMTLKPDEAAPGPFVKAPQPNGSPEGVIVPMPYRTWLPSAETLTKPRPLPGESERVFQRLRARPALDVPPVADAGSLVPPPSPVRLPAAPAVAVASPDPGQVAVTSVAARAAPFDRPTVMTDPTPDASHRAAVAAAPPTRQKPAPFLRLTIPAPSPIDSGAEFRSHLPDDDPPVSPPGLPGRVTLR